MTRTSTSSARSSRTRSPSGRHAGRGGVTASAGRYPVPGARHRVEESIRRSRFITTVARAATGGDAHAFIDGIRAEFPDARHNCWAFVAGPPGST
ncbi:MAG: YigZ family protein, partial [Gemmatimonadota bacterium]